MPGVLAWIVAVTRHAPLGGQANPIDLPAETAGRALDLAEWLLQHRADTRLLLNISVAPGTPQAQRLLQLAAQGQVLNAATADRADAAALHGSLKQLRQPPLADTLLLLWLGHGVMLGRQRYLVNQDSQGPESLSAWDVDSLLLKLRSGPVPQTQIGFFDTCAQVVDVQPGHEVLGGDGKTPCNQFFYFAASSAAEASLSVDDTTLSSLALAALRATPWPEGGVLPRAALDSHLQAGMAQLPSRPVAWEWTSGSGDRWSGGASDPRAAARLAAQALRSGLATALFMHLLAPAQELKLTPSALATACAQGKVHELAAKLAKKQPDEALALAEAWGRVCSVSIWLQPAVQLGLGLASWQQLADRLAHDELRATPARFTELPQLLLWATDRGGFDAQGVRRSDLALLQVLWQAAQHAAGQPGGAAASQALQAQLQQHPVFAPLVPALRARLTQLEEAEPAPVLIVDLEPAPGGRNARIKQHWVQQGQRLQRGAALPQPGKLGEDLNLLINRAQKGHRQPVRVELLATRALFLGNFEWRGYELRMGRDKAWEPLDTRFPIYWRWKERLHGEHAENLQAHWTLRTQAVRARAPAGAGLRCRFDGETPAADDSHVLALGYAPKTNTGGFFKALLQGEPYMLWPSSPPADATAFRHTVAQWLATLPLHRLPEALCQALAGPAFPRVVLFFDEPERNPYTQLPDFVPVQPAPP